MSLRLVPAYVEPTPPTHDHPNDLPPAWDGLAVVWREWQLLEPTTLVYHLPLEDLACDKCGSLEPRTWYAGGLRALSQAVTRSQLEGAQAARKAGQFGAWTLAAYRCADCGHDRVLDLDTWELWDLDPDDYADVGSWDGDPALF